MALKRAHLINLLRIVKAYYAVKKILVPTDFSPVADNAIHYAIGIATKLKCNLYLCHVYSFDRFNYDLDAPEHKQPYTRAIERKMKRTEQKFSDKIKQEGLTITTIVERDDFSSLFGRKAKELEIDMIIMGSKGASGIEKLVFGSVAGSALDWAKIPVLIIRPGHFFRAFEHIILAIDHNEIAKSVIMPLHKLASNFGANVTLLNISKGSNQSAHRKTKLLALEGIKSAYQEIPMSNSINETINQYVKKEGCDLLCMIRRKKGFFESFLKGSLTRAQAYNSEAPLLVLPERR